MFLDGNACQRPRRRLSSARVARPRSQPRTRRFAGRLLGRERAPDGDDAGPKPVFGFVEEVREMDVVPASDGLFVPPPNYKLRNPERPADAE